MGGESTDGVIEATPFCFGFIIVFAHYQLRADVANSAASREFKASMTTWLRFINLKGLETCIKL